jgi:hypothetical protein
MRGSKGRQAAARFIPGVSFVFGSMPGLKQKLPAMLQPEPEEEPE